MDNRNRKSLARALAALLLLLALAALAACKGKGRPRGGDTGGQVVEVTEADLPAQVLATGAVKAQVGAQVKVGPRVSGRLEHLAVKVGDHVAKGQVLARIEQRDLQAAVDRARAALAEAEASRGYADANYARLSKLVGEGVVTADAVDSARKAVEASRAQVKSAEASLRNVEVQLSYATVTAPISGTVGSVSTQEGETVAASLSAPTFVTIIDLARLQVDAYVDEVDIGRVAVGQKATFTVDAFPDRTWNATVEAIYPQAVIQDNVVNYDVILSVDDPYEGVLRPEMTTSVAITLDTLKGALVVPARAIRREGGKTAVKVREGEKVVERPVTLGRESGELVQVLAGLSKGDKVLVPRSQNSAGQGGP